MGRKTAVGGEVTRLSNMKMGYVMKQTARFSDSKYLTEGPALLIRTLNRYCAFSRPWRHQKIALYVKETETRASQISAQAKQSDGFTISASTPYTFIQWRYLLIQRHWQYT
jgi:hypothetical protein